MAKFIPSYIQAILVSHRRGINGNQFFRVTAQSGSMRVSKDGSLSWEDEYARAAAMFAAKYEWEGTYVGASLPNGDYVFVDARNAITESSK